MPRSARGDERSAPSWFRPPTITDDTVQSFTAVYEKLYNKPIAPDDAREMARRVLTLYTVLARPLPEELETVRQQQGERLPQRTSP